MLVCMRQLQLRADPAVGMYIWVIMPHNSCAACDPSLREEGDWEIAVQDPGDAIRARKQQDKGASGHRRMRSLDVSVQGITVRSC